jgi:histidine triad (HIT) family protein
MVSVFTKIRNKEIPGIIFDDNGEFFVIHSNNPAQLGHLLVIPYQEIDYIFDLDSEVYHKLWDYVKNIATRLQNITGAKKIGIKVEGLEVAHVHIHLIPINQAGDLEAASQIKETDIQQLQQEFKQ